MEEKMVDKISALQPVKDLAKKHQDHSARTIQKAEEKPVNNKDTVSVEHESAITTYGKLAGVEVGSPYQLLKQLVIKTLTDQKVPTLISLGQTEINLETLTPEAATDLISEDGYFGVEKTSQRIVDFAINAFGNDPAKLTQMKDAIEKGFQDAADVFGGQLPEISHQTYAAVMDKLDTFAGVKAEDKGENHG
jgi:hypothetical protein